MMGSICGKGGRPTAFIKYAYVIQERERENFIRHTYKRTVYINSTTIREMWQVARKGTMPITLTTLKIEKETNMKNMNKHEHRHKTH